MAQKRKSEWHVLIGVRVIDSIWLRRSLRDEHEWQAAHMEPSAPALIPATGTCLCSDTCAQIFTPCTHMVLL